MANYPQIVVGTYEEFLLGYVLLEKNDSSSLKLNLASHAHQGSIRCVASHGHLLASSGADEYINIFSITTRKELAVLTPHSGTVTCLTFTPDGSHLVSASQDGNIAIIRCSDWTVVKEWKEAHKRSNGVLGLAIHPSGKLLLSIGADHVLRAWNMIKGRQAYATNFGKKLTVGNTLNLVVWSQDGDQYAVGIGQIVEVYNVEKAAVIYSTKSESKIACMDFSKNGVLALGRDDGCIEFHNVAKKKKINENSQHAKRVKCVKFHVVSEKEEIFVSADSQGNIKTWLWQEKENQLAMKAEVNADCRIVCLTLVDEHLAMKKESEDDLHEVNNVLNLLSKVTERVIVTNEASVSVQSNGVRREKVKVVRKKKKKSKSIETVSISQNEASEDLPKSPLSGEIPTNGVGQEKGVKKKRSKLIEGTTKTETPISKDSKSSKNSKLVGATTKIETPISKDSKSSKNSKLIGATTKTETPISRDSKSPKSSKKRVNSNVSNESEPIKKRFSTSKWEVE